MDTSLGIQLLFAVFVMASMFPKMKKELVYGCGISFPENKNIGLLR